MESYRNSESDAAPVSVLPAPPPGMHHRAERYDGEDYISVGAFAPGAPRDLDHSGGVGSLFFDCDLADWYWATRIDPANATLGNVTSVGAKKQLKKWLHELPQGKLVGLLDEHLGCIAGVLAWLGLTATHIVRSGYGHHVHIHLDAWHPESDTKARAFTTAVVDAVAGQLHYGLFDPGTTLGGIQLCRAVGGKNRKGPTTRAVVRVEGDAAHRMTIRAWSPPVDALVGSEESRARVAALLAAHRSADQAALGVRLRTGCGPKGVSGVQWDVPPTTRVQAKDGTERSLAEWAPHVTRKVPCYCPVHDDGSPSAVIFVHNGTAFVHCRACAGNYWPARGDHAVGHGDTCLAPSSVTTTTPTPPAVSGTKYLSLTAEEVPPGVHIIRADTGTGKTTSEAAILADARKTGKRVLVLVHRQGLANDAARVYDLRCYLSDNENRELVIAPGEGVVLSIQSLLRLSWPGADDVGNLMDGGSVTDGAPDIIVIEEVEALLAAFDGSTIPKVRGPNGRATARETYRRLETLIRACLARGGRVIALDALAGKVTDSVLTRLTGRVPTVHHHRWTADDPEIISHDSRWGIVTEVLAAAAAPDRRPCIACTSANDARRIHHILFAAGYRGIIATSDEAPERRASGASLTQGWETADYVVYSPTIDSGVNYDPPETAHRFTDVFVVAASVAGVGWRSLVQMRHRARHHDRVHIWVAGNYQHSLAVDEAAIRAQVAATWRGVKQTIVRYVEDPTERGLLVAEKYDDDEYLASMVDTRAGILRGWADVAADWSAYWKSRGATVTVAVTPDAAVERAAKALWRAAGNTVDEDYDDAVLSIPSASQRQVEEIQRRGPMSREEALQLRKARLLDRFGHLRSGLALLDRHGRRTRAVIAATRGALVSDGEPGRVAEARMGDDLQAMANRDAFALTGASSRVRVAVLLTSVVLGRGWMRSLLPAGLQADPDIEWVTEMAHTPHPEPLPIYIEGGVCHPTTATWSTGGFSLTSMWSDIVASLPDAVPALAALGLTPRDLDANPTRAVGSIIRYLGLNTTCTHTRVAGRRVRTYRVDSASWDVLKADLCRTAHRAKGEAVTDWDLLPDARNPSTPDGVDVDHLLDDLEDEVPVVTSTPEPAEHRPVDEDDYDYTDEMWAEILRAIGADDRREGC